MQLVRCTSLTCCRCIPIAFVLLVFCCVHARSNPLRFIQLWITHCFLPLTDMLGRVIGNKLHESFPGRFLPRILACCPTTTLCRLRLIAGIQQSYHHCDMVCVAARISVFSFSSSAALIVLTKLPFSSSLSTHSKRP